MRMSMIMNKAVNTVIKLWDPSIRSTIRMTSVLFDELLLSVRSFRKVTRIIKLDKSYMLKPNCINYAIKNSLNMKNMKASLGNTGLKIKKIKGKLTV